jgi:hypothetical protein
MIITGLAGSEGVRITVRGYTFIADTIGDLASTN